MAHNQKFKLAYVTTFATSKLDLYGQKLINSLCSHVDEQVFLVVDGEVKLNQHYKNLNVVENDHAVHMKELYADFPRTSDYRFSPNRFCFKTSSIMTVKNKIASDYDYLVWIDADSVVKKSGFTEFIVRKLLPGSSQIASFFDRNSSYGYCETGLLVFNLKHPRCGSFIDNWGKPFESSAILNFAEWHDAFLFSHFARMYKPGMFRYLCNDYKLKTSHPIYEFRELRKYIEHLKGDTRKRLGFSPEKYGINPAYFTILLRLIKFIKHGGPK